MGARGMRRRYVRGLVGGLLVAASAALTLSGCTTFGFGTSTPAQAQVADLPDIGGYTAGAALDGARSHFKANDFGYSAALYKRVVELTPKDPQGYVGLGASYDRMGRFDLSDRVYASLFQLTGGTAQYYNNVGYSNMLRGNLTVALTNFRKAKKIDPQNIVVANNLQILANAAAARA